MKDRAPKIIAIAKFKGDRKKYRELAYTNDYYFLQSLDYELRNNAEVEEVWFIDTRNGFKQHEMIDIMELQHELAIDDYQDYEECFFD
jgi:hypothetical protein